MIVEDEYFLAEDLAVELRGRGAEVLGPVATLSDARQVVADQDFDMAVLDMNLRGDMSAPIADALYEAGVPTLLVTGYSREALPEHLREAPYLEKPTEARQVAGALGDLLGFTVKH